MSGPGPQGELCEDCYYWEAKSTDGLCHLMRSASTAGVSRDGYVGAQWVRMQPDDWCGEWKNRPGGGE